MQPQCMSLIMEYVPHGNLFRSIQQDSKGTLQWWDRGRHVALDIAKGLAYLHSRKVVLSAARISCVLDSKACPSCQALNKVSHIYVPAAVHFVTCVTGADHSP